MGIVFSYEIALAEYPMENLYVTEQGAALDAILKTVFTPRGIDYRVVDKVVVLTRSAHPAQTVKAAPAKAQQPAAKPAPKPAPKGDGAVTL